MRARQIGVYAVVVLAVTAAAGACSSSIETGDGKIDKPGKVLSSGMSQLKKDNKRALHDGSATVSKKSHCFFMKKSKDDDDVGDTIACGPIRRLGHADAKSWDTYSLDMRQNSDGDVKADLDARKQKARTVKTERLKSPDEKPANVGDVPAPKAPEANVKNKAVLVSAKQAGNIGFHKLDKPSKLITPAATVTVAASGKPKRVPKQLVSGGHAPYYRPAKGQTVMAYKVKVSPPAEKKIPVSSSEDDPGLGSGQDYANMTSVMSLTIPGGKQVGIKDGAKSWKISCDASDSTDWGSGDDAFPCGRTKTDDAVLITSVPSDSDTTGLQAKVNGETQSVNLKSGKLSSSVSQVEYKHSDLVTEIDEQARSKKKVTYKDALDDRQSTTGKWTWNIKSAGLSAFDPTRGWAGKGKAWLVVSTSDYDTSATNDASDLDFDDDMDPTVTVDGKTYKPDMPSDTDWDDNKYTFAFKVPQSTEQGTFNMQPSGKFTGADSNKKFTASKATVKFDFGK